MEFVFERPELDTFYSLFAETGWNKVMKLQPEDWDTALNHQFLVLCVYEEDELIGFGRVISDQRVYACIYDVIVRKSYQKQGLGAEIVRRLVAECEKRNIYSIHLFAAEGTISFYEKLGFKIRPDSMPGMKYEPTGKERNDV